MDLKVYHSGLISRICIHTYKLSGFKKTIFLIKKSSLNQRAKPSFSSLFSEIKRILNTDFQVCMTKCVSRINQSQICEMD
jgi:hypothetical protein